MWEDIKYKVSSKSKMVGDKFDFSWMIWYGMIHPILLKKNKAQWFQIAKWHTTHSHFRKVKWSLEELPWVTVSPEPKILFQELSLSLSLSLSAWRWRNGRFQKKCPQRSHDVFLSKSWRQLKTGWCISNNETPSHSLPPPQTKQRILQTGPLLLPHPVF